MNNAAAWRQNQNRGRAAEKGRGTVIGAEITTRREMQLSDDAILVLVPIIWRYLQYPVVVAAAVLCGSRYQQQYCL